MPIQQTGAASTAVPVVLAGQVDHDPTVKRALRQMQRLFDTAETTESPGGFSSADTQRRAHLGTQTTPSERITVALLQSAGHVDIQTLSQMTGLPPQELSWRLLRLAQHDQISRKRKTDESGERYFYYLDAAQTKRLQHLADDLDAELPLTKPMERVLRALQSTKASPTDTVAIGRIEKALARAGVAMSRVEVTWRLTCLVRLDQISRSRNAPSSPYQYFLREDQDLALTHLLAIHGEAGWRVAIARRRNIESEIKQVSTQREENERAIQELQATLATEKEASAAAAATRDTLAEQFSNSLLRAQADPVLLAERVGFLKKLLERPALESLAVLRGILQDYENALAMARED